MIVLWILLAVAILLVLLAFLHIYLIFDYHTEPKITLRVLCFRFDGIDFVKKFLMKDRKDAGLPEKEPQKSQNQSQKKNASGDMLGFVEFLLHLTEVIHSTVNDFFSKAIVNLKELHISLGTDDAAKTALLSCGVIQAANGLCAVLQRVSKFRCSSKNLSITPNYTSEESKFSLHLVISCTLIHLISVYIRTNMRFFD